MKFDEPKSIHEAGDSVVSAGTPAHEAFLVAILNSATDYAIFTLDCERRVTSWNVGACNLVGYSPEEIIGQSGDIIFTPEDVEAGAPHAEENAVREYGRAEDERWHVRRNGTRFWASGVVTPLHDGARGFLKVLRDLTRERRERLALEASERRFRTLAENIPQLVFRSLSTGERTWGSPQWENYTGLSLPESLNYGWLNAIHPDDREPTLQAWREAQPDRTYFVEHRIRQGLDEIYRWHQTRALPIRVDDGRVEWVGTSTDVHEMRMLQERQGVLLAELQHRTRNLLAIVSSIAEQTMRSSPSSHEFEQDFTGRLRTLSRVQGLLTRSETEKVLLSDIVLGELYAHGAEPGGRVTVEGEAVELPPKAVQTMALAVHELATNALKYGALKGPAGHLAVRWHVERTGAGRVLRLDWTESGVPMPEEPPKRKGYGRQLIEKGIPYDVDAETRLEFGPDGVRCRIDLQLPDEEDA
jgi:PAS domain S-box-containing protein